MPGTGAHVTPQHGMAPEAMAVYLQERLEDRAVEAKVAYGQLTLTVRPEAFPTAAQLCKQDERLAFDFFDFLSGVDLAEQGFAVVAHLYSLRYRHHVTLRAVATGGRETPTLPTLTGVYRGANWHERETYDMFGIEFDGHPGLLPRILTVENFEGWPLRKEFLLSTREAKPWPGLKEPKAPEEDRAEGEDGATPGPSAEDKAAAAKAKAERAKEKAAAMRAKKSQERAAEQQAASAGQAVGADRPAETTARGEEATTPDKRSEQRAPEPADTGEQAQSARETHGGDTEGPAAAAAAVAAGDADAQTPEGAAEVAGTDVAKDAAAGAPSGDTFKGAPQDAPGYDQPVEDPDEEARVAEGAKGTASGAPGVEAEGRHGGAERQGGDVPAAETSGLTSPTQSDEAARTAHETPAPEAGEPSEPSAGDLRPAGTRRSAGASVGVESLEDSVEHDDVATDPPDGTAPPAEADTDAQGRVREDDTPEPGSTGSGTGTSEAGTGAAAADRSEPGDRDARDEDRESER